MYIEITLGVLLLLSILFNVILLLRRKNTESELNGLLEHFLQGDLEYGRDNIETLPKGEQSYRLAQSMNDLATLLGDVQQNSQKSERATARLSRNIQKALLYTSKISAHASGNLETSSRLFQLVAEGSAAVEEIHASIGSLKDQVSTQNREISQTSQAINSISQSLSSISGIASQRLQDTQSLVKLTAVGNRKIKETDQVINMVQGKVDDILTLITMINKIASQTNLLSMNAAIEAAHAGDAGRGFAVVAQEIRNLAESTSNNAKSISETLKDLVAHIESAAQLSKESGSAFNQIEEGVDQVSQAFTQINEQTSSVADHSQEVVHSASALQEISQQTTISMNEMEVGTSDINKILESSKEISEEMEVSMKDLASKTKSVNWITSKISSSYLTANHSMASILNLFRQYNSRLSGKEMVDTASRMTYSNLILSHINWVAMARAVIDRSVEKEDVNLVDSTHCELGKWINKEESRNLLGEEKMRRLSTLHRDLHNLVGEIFQGLESSGKDVIEKKYDQLNELSQKIVQILTTIGYNDFIQWSPELSVQVKEFDQHHGVLISLINKLYVSMEEGQGAENLSRIFEELLHYTEFHFTEEEKVLEYYQSPQLEEQKKQHSALLKKARELNNDFHQGKSVLSNEVLDFLQDWVMNHILRVDKKYGEPLKDKDIHSLVKSYKART